MSELVIAKAPVSDPISPHFFYVVTSVEHDPNNVIGYGFDVCENLAREKAIFEYAEKKLSFDRIERLKSGAVKNAISIKELVHYNGPFLSSGSFREIQFFEFTSLRSGEIKQLPIRGRLHNSDVWQEISPISTSGFAAHVTPKLALQKAIFEVIERDAFFLCWYGNIAAQILPISSEMVDRYFIGLTEKKLELKVLLLPSFNQIGFAVAALLIRKTGEGYMVGLGAEKLKDEAIEKAISEVAFFYCWNEIYSENSFKSDINLANYGGYPTHLDFFWNQGKQSYLNLLSGDEIEISGSQELENLESGGQLFGNHFPSVQIGERKICIANAAIVGAIPQHSYSGHTLNFDAVCVRYPSFALTWPVFGLHPFT
jgi:YcaO cyclodehydratase, ATP-ad Mg2+-binding